MGCKGKKIRKIFFSHFKLLFIHFSVHTFFNMFFVLCCALQKNIKYPFKYFQNFILRWCICICLKFMCSKQTVQGLSKILQNRGIKTLKIFHTVAGELLLPCACSLTHLLLFLHLVFRGHDRLYVDSADYNKQNKQCKHFITD